MSVKSLTRLVVFGDPKKGHVNEVISDFASFVSGKAEVLASCDIDKCTPELLNECDFAVVFGGDGSIISAARNLNESNVPVIGVNLGKLGYLAEFSVEELERYFDEVASGKADIEKRMMLNCSVCSGAASKRFSSAAINDVVITAGPPYRMIELEISVNGQQLANCVSDGLIISTPTGSTAYNLSAGGPILSAGIEAIVVTAICPHSLSFRPIVIDAESQVEVSGLRLNEGTTLSVDGQLPMRLESNDIVTIKRESNSFLVVSNPLRTKWDTLAGKLGWAKKPEYKEVK